MNGFEAYQTYLAVKNHFSSKGYDFFKYNGKMKVSETKFQSRRDRFSFEKAAKRFKRDDFVKYLVANFSTSSAEWIGDLMNGKSEIAYKKWLKNLESLAYNFREELSLLHEREQNFNNLFAFDDGHPLLYRMYMRHAVSINTLVILDDLVGFSKAWSKKDDIMLNDLIFLLDKYKPFIYTYNNVERTKYKKIVLDIFSS